MGMAGDTKRSSPIGEDTARGNKINLLGEGVPNSVASMEKALTKVIICLASDDMDN